MNKNPYQVLILSSRSDTALALAAFLSAVKGLKVLFVESDFHRAVVLIKKTVLLSVGPHLSYLVRLNVVHNSEISERLRDQSQFEIAFCSGRVSEKTLLAMASDCPLVVDASFHNELKQNLHFSLHPTPKLSSKRSEVVSLESELFVDLAPTKTQNLGPNWLKAEAWLKRHELLRGENPISKRKAPLSWVQSLESA